MPNANIFNIFVREFDTTLSKNYYTTNGGLSFTEFEEFYKVLKNAGLIPGYGFFDFCLSDKPNELWFIFSYDKNGIQKNKFL